MHLAGVTEVVDSHVRDNCGTHRDSATPGGCKQGHFRSVEDAGVDWILVGPISMDSSVNGERVVSCHCVARGRKV